MEWQTVQVIIALLGGFSVTIGILSAVTKPSREETKEQRKCNQKQQEVLGDLQVAITELNVTLKKANELDIIRDNKISKNTSSIINHDKRILLTEREIEILKDARESKYTKDRY